MDLNGKNYTVVQLQKWLKQLNLKCTGNKETLLQRLCEVPPEERGSAPVADEDEENLDHEETTTEVYKRALDLMRREKQLLERENEFLKRVADMNISGAGGCSPSLVGQQRIPLDVLKELIPPFFGETNIEFWVIQIKGIRDTYTVEDNIMRAIIGSKLVGKALNWFHTNVEFATMTVNTLLEKMSEYFGTKESKLILRRRFEARTWNVEENFAEYFNEKVTLSVCLHIDETEIIDHIIEGIPSENLRTQAHLQCFKSKAQLLQAFSKISLKPRVPAQRQRVSQSQPMDVRCYNCGEVGHYSSSCKSPKREFGACFGCGSKEHRVNVCPQRKKDVVVVEENDYVRRLKFIFNTKLNNFCYLEALIDSGSPISFIRKSIITQFDNVIFIPKNINEPEYFGLNKSRLITFGKILCYVSLENTKIEINLIVVADESVSFDIVLGRDFLFSSHAKIIFESETSKPNCVTKVDVLKKDCETQVDLDYRSGVKDTSNEKTICCKHDISYDSCNTLLSIDYDIKLNRELSVGGIIGHEQTQKLHLMFEKFYVQPQRPIEPKIKCLMKLSLNSDKPFNCPPRRTSYVEKLKLQELLDEYLKKGYIRPSESEYSSPIVLVKKKTGDLRMCVDYRTLNKITARDNYPIPLIDDLLDRLENKIMFTKFDLKNGFFHIFMDKDSVRYTSFVTQLGQFEFLRIPFGLRNAPSVFQRFINKIFADMIRSDKVILYLDDIMIATEGVEEHFSILIEVFKRLVDNKLELRIDKCEFFQSSITYLGYKVTGEGIRADDKGLSGVKDFPVPTKLQSVQSFLGLCSYFRRFVKDFSVLAKPLYDLTRKSEKFKFGPREIECFELLKQKLLASPVLALYNPHDETELHCDASTHGFGAILLQKKQDGKFHPIFYFSKRTTEVESKYHSFELEALAIVYALKRFRIYLQGKHFKIITDCNALTLTLNKKELNPRIARWALEMQNFCFDLEHRNGEKMQHVDALSRSTNVLVLQANTFEDNLIICQSKDTKIRELQESLQKSEHKYYEMRNSVVYRKTGNGQILFYVPENMEQQVIHKYHDEMGHVGVEKVRDLITKTYWFPKLKEKISTYVQSCLSCIVFSPKNGRVEGYLHIIPKGKEPFKVVHIDHFGPIDNIVKIKKYILVVVDAFTKFVRLYSTKTTNTKEVISSLSDYFRAYSRPECIISDRGSAFTSTDFANFLGKHEVKHIKVATGSPQANGQVERINRSIKQMIAKLVNPNKGVFWTSVVESVEFCLNNTMHKLTGQHPSVLLFGKNQRQIVSDPLKEKLSDIVTPNPKKKLKSIRKMTVLLQLKAQKYNKKYFDKKRQKANIYNVGDYVVIKNFDSHIATSKKLIPKYKGPYRVARVLKNDRYLLKDIDGFQQTQIPYVGVWAVSNIRPWIVERVLKKKKKDKEKGKGKKK